MTQQYVHPLREAFAYFWPVRTFLRLVLPTRSCPTSISLVWQTLFSPVCMASLYAFSASGPLARISSGIVGGTAENYIEQKLVPYQQFFFYIVFYAKKQTPSSSILVKYFRFHASFIQNVSHVCIHSFIYLFINFLIYSVELSLHSMRSGATKLGQIENFGVNFLFLLTCCYKYFFQRKSISK